MTRRSAWKGLGFAAAVGCGALLLSAAVAWACLPVANIKAAPATAQGGQQVNITGSEFGSNPVQIHFNALDGLVLATLTPDSNGNISGAVTIPANAPTGPAVLIATEAAATPSGGGGSSPGVPTRAVVQIVGPGGSAPLSVSSAGQGRPSGVVTSSSGVATGALLLVGLGAFGVALFLAGGLALLTSGRREEASAQKVRS